MYNIFRLWIFICAINVNINIHCKDNIVEGNSYEFEKENPIININNDNKFNSLENQSLLEDTDIKKEKNKKIIQWVNLAIFGITICIFISVVYKKYFYPIKSKKINDNIVNGNNLENKPQKKTNHLEDFPDIIEKLSPSMGQLSLAYSVDIGFGGLLSYLKLLYDMDKDNFSLKNSLEPHYILKKIFGPVNFFNALNPETQDSNILEYNILPLTGIEAINSTYSKVDKQWNLFIVVKNQINHLAPNKLFNILKPYKKVEDIPEIKDEEIKIIENMSIGKEPIIQKHEKLKEYYQVYYKVFELEKPENEKMVEKFCTSHNIDVNTFFKENNDFVKKIFQDINDIDVEFNDELDLSFFQKLNESAMENVEQEEKKRKIKYTFFSRAVHKNEITFTQHQKWFEYMRNILINITKFYLYEIIYWDKDFQKNNNYEDIQEKIKKNEILTHNEKIIKGRKNIENFMNKLNARINSFEELGEEFNNFLKLFLQYQKNLEEIINKHFIERTNQDGDNDKDYRKFLTGVVNSFINYA